MKTHYAEDTQPNESDTRPEESKTLCGLTYTEAPVTSDITLVTCNNCWKRILRLSINKLSLGEAVDG